MIIGTPGDTGGQGFPAEWDVLSGRVLDSAPNSRNLKRGWRRSIRKSSAFLKKAGEDLQAVVFRLTGDVSLL